MFRAILPINYNY